MRLFATEDPMRETILRLLVTALALLTLVCGAAQADVIVNISGTANGEDTGGQDCSVACEGPQIDPVQHTFGPGTYSITDAWSPTSGLATGALYDAWNFQSANP